MDWLGLEPTLPPVAEEISQKYKTYEPTVLPVAEEIAEKYDGLAHNPIDFHAVTDATFAYAGMSAYFPSTVGADAEDLRCFFPSENVYPEHASIDNGIPVDDEWLRVSGNISKECRYSFEAPQYLNNIQTKPLAASFAQPLPLP
jgi:hypothetical protein